MRKLDDTLELLKLLECILDELNSKYGNEKELCLYCHSDIYDTSGIVHREKCVILRLRKLIWKSGNAGRRN